MRLKTPSALLRGRCARNRNRNLLIFNKEYFLCAICATAKTIDFLHNSPGTRPVHRMELYHRMVRRPRGMAVYFPKYNLLTVFAVSARRAGLKCLAPDDKYRPRPRL
jgi:hypothetical protein